MLISLRTWEFPSPMEGLHPSSLQKLAAPCDISGFQTLGKLLYSDFVLFAACCRALSRFECTMFGIANVQLPGIVVVNSACSKSRHMPTYSIHCIASKCTQSSSPLLHMRLEPHHDQIIAVQLHQTDWHCQTNSVQPLMIPHSAKAWRQYCTS